MIEEYDYFLFDWDGCFDFHSLKFPAMLKFLTSL